MTSSPLRKLNIFSEPFFSDRTLFGQFFNFNDGDRIGNFNGVDLFIKYHSGGTGNDGFSFLAVPEPSFGLWLVIATSACCLHRRRAKRTIDDVAIVP
jgi:hypothetical protein